MQKADGPKSTLPQNLAQVDSAAVTRMVVNPKNDGPYELLRKNGIWKLKLENGKEVTCESKLVNNSFAGLFNSKPSQIVSRKQEKWNAYEVSDSAAIKISLYNGENELGGLFIGKFDFNQQTSSMSNYLRIAGSNDILKCDKPLSFDWNKSSNDWRNKTILSIQSSTVSKVSGSGQANFSLVKDDLTGWTSEGILMDSTAITNFLNDISNLNAKDFDDNMSVSDLGSPVQTIEVYTELEDITISLYETPAGPRVHSTTNAQNVFVADSLMIGKLIPINEELVEEE
ncbi:MAG: DUF4340 domain-containing protein [Bacteroidia bacterium]